MSYVRNMTRDQAVDRMEDIQAEMEPLGAKPRLSDRDQARFDELSDEFNDLDGHVRRLDRAAEMVRAGSGRGRFRLERGSIGEEEPRRADGVRSEAMRTLDRAVQSGRLEASGAELVEDLTRSGSMLAQSWTQRCVAATGDEHYEAAFAKLVADPARGHLRWTPEEGEAFRVVEALRDEQRAMSTTDNAGGYLSPLIVDPSVLITSAAVSIRCARFPVWCKRFRTRGMASPVRV
jgi:predicted phage gp36 major capsid-like protein